MFVGALCHKCLLPAGRGLCASGRWLRLLRSPLRAASGTAVVTQRGMCHPLLPLQPPSPLPSQSLLFLLWSIILNLQYFWFKILIIKENWIYNLCWLLGSQKKMSCPRSSQKYLKLSHQLEDECGKHAVSWALTYTLLNILGSAVSFPFINVKLTTRYNKMYHFSSLDRFFFSPCITVFVTLPYYTIWHAFG